MGIFVYNLSMERETIITGLRQQHKQLQREEVYDGHNRHSGIIDMHTLTIRGRRRLWKQRMRQLAGTRTPLFSG